MRFTPGALLLLVSACTTCQREAGVPAPVEPDAAPRRLVRDVLSPPVRAYPPHAIRSDGVGPYLLGQPLTEVLRKLPEGLNLEVLQLGRYASWLVVNAEGGEILVGAEVKGPVQFVAVVARDVARTSSGVGVGATGDQLLEALGKPRRPAGVRNRLVYQLDALPGARFITDSPEGTPPERARVVAVLLAKPDEAPPHRVCPAPEAVLPEDDVRQAARVKADETVTVRAGCFTGGAADALVLQGGEVILVGGDPARLRRLAAAPAAPEATAGALDLDGDGRDEVVLIEPRRGDREFAVGVRALRWEGGHLSEVLSARPFVLTEQMAAAAGATLPQIDVAIEVSAAGGQVMVEGTYLAAGPQGLRQVAPLEPVALRLETRKGAQPPVPDAGDNR